MLTHIHIIVGYVVVSLVHHKSSTEACITKTSDLMMDNVKPIEQQSGECAKFLIAALHSKARVHQAVFLDVRQTGE